MAIRADGKPGGANGEVQYNDGCTFAGAPALNYDKATDQIVVQGQANHSASLGPELITNSVMEFNADGWTGTGWTWGPSPEIGEPAGVLIHDPLETDWLINADLIANTDDVLLIRFFIIDYVSGAVEVMLTQPPFSTGGDSRAVIAGNGFHTIALHANADAAQLVFNPQPSGYADVFDGTIWGPISAQKITFSDPVLISKLSDASNGSFALQLGNGDSVLVGLHAGAGIDPTLGSNLVFGGSAMEAAYLASANVALGLSAMRYAANAADNIAIGLSALRAGAEAHTSVAIGSQALINAYQSVDNTALGDQTGVNLARGTGNVLIGAQAGSDIVNADYQLRISHWISDPVPLVAGDFQAQTLTIGGDLSVASGKYHLIEDDDAPGTFYKLKINSGVLSIEAV